MLINFPSLPVMVARLADVIETRLALSIAQTGRGRLAVSGGSTPAPLYEALSKRQIDWQKVTATLVDERWVAPGQAGSNESFLHQTLKKNYAKDVIIQGLWRDTQTPFEAEAIVNNDLSQDKSVFDAVILGMGPDGHTASWFPEADGLGAFLKSKNNFAATKAHRSDVTGAHVYRMTMTPSAFAGAHFTCLMMTGTAKLTTWHKAIADGPVVEMPVRHLIETTPNLWACHAPDMT